MERHKQRCGRCLHGLRFATRIARLTPMGIIVAACACRIECERIELADGSTLLMCVGCETYAEGSSYRGRLVRLDDTPLPRSRRAKAA
jgi:hypothetical protein